MAKIVEMSYFRDSISDPWPEGNTPRAETWESIVHDIMNTYNGVLSVEFSEDNLQKNVVLMFPDETNLPDVRAAFEAGLNHSASDQAEIQAMKDAGKYQMTIVDE